MMRRRGIFILLSSGLFIGIWAFFFGEQFIEAKIEQAASKILATKVEIDNLQIYRDPAISFDKLRIVDPHNSGENLIEIGYTGFFLEARPLFYGKVIINELRFTDIQFWTPRDSRNKTAATMLRLPPWLSRIEDSLRRQIKTPPIGALLAGEKIPADELVSLLDLKTLRHLEKIESQVDSTYKNCLDFLSETEPSNPDMPGSGKNSANSRESRLRQAQRRANRDFGSLASDLSETDKQIELDLNNLRNKSLPLKIDPAWIGKMLYGDLAVQAIVEILRYVDLVRRTMPVAEQRLKNVKEKNPPRGVGQDIHFPIANSDPKFLIKKLVLRSPPNQKEAKDKLRVRGEISGLTSHPGIYNKMQKIEVSARYPNPRKYGIVATIDYTKDEPWEQFQLLGTGLDLFSFDLPDHPYLPNHVITDHGKLGGGFEITGDRINGRIGVTAIPAIFQFAKSSPGNSTTVKKILADLESRKRYYIGVRLRGTFDELKLQVYSSIDIPLAQAIEKILSTKSKWDQQEVTATVDSILTVKKNQVAQLFNKRKTAIRSQISRYGEPIQ